MVVGGKVLFDTLRILASEGFRTARHKSAVQPLLWLCLIVTLPCLFLAPKEDGAARIGLFAIGSVPVLLFVVAYCYFMIRDPDRLHSEDYQLRSRALDIVETKGGIIKVDPVNIPNIATPQDESRKLADPHR